MPNCYDIPESSWIQAHRALRLYFSRRQGPGNAEDLAQETLLRIWARPDYEFADVKDFLRVAYGFAANVGRQQNRSHDHSESEELPLNLPEKLRTLGRLSGVEIDLFMEQIARAAERELSSQDRRLVLESYRKTPSEIADSLGIDANTIRVRLFRALKRLRTKLERPAANR